MLFGPGPIRLQSLKPWTQEQVRRTPMLYRADLDFAIETVPHLEDFAMAVQRALPWLPDDAETSLDLKVLMLKRGWYPCIPGWHLDDFTDRLESSLTSPTWRSTTLNTSWHSSEITFLRQSSSSASTTFLSRPVTSKYTVGTRST